MTVSALDTETELAIARLAEYRFRQNLTFRQLSQQMGARDCYIPMRSLHLILTHRVTPVDRTQYRIKTFVAQLPSAVPQKKRTRRSSAA